MENKIGKLNFCIVLFAVVCCVVLFYTQFMGIFEAASIEETAFQVGYIIYFACGLVAVVGLLWVAIDAILKASKGQAIGKNIPFYGFAIFGVTLLVKNLVFMQVVDIWSNPDMWVGVVLGLFVLGASLFAILFSGKALNIMGFVISAVLIGYFAFKGAGFLGGMMDYQNLFLYFALATLFVFTAIAYTNQISKSSQEQQPTVKKVKKN